MTGGWNSLLFRAKSESRDLAIKFSVADERDRAGREYEALSAIGELKLDIMPDAVHLDRDNFSQPVMVQSWLDGVVSTELPTSDDDWGRWVEHMATIHAITPDRVSTTLRQGVLTAFSVDEAKALINDGARRTPVEARPAALSAVIDACMETRFPEWARPAPTLCRVDSAIQNFVQRPDHWASVDWENAGWGDPAFEIADLLNHAAHVTMPAERRTWFVERYCARVADPEMATRIWTYQRIMLVWWAVRTYRYLYEMPRGLDPRLAQLPDNWEADIRAKYERYLSWATSLF